MKMASADLAGSARLVVKNSRSSRTLVATSSARPGSKIGISPLVSWAILSASLSTQVTMWPKSAKQAPEIRPTYPEPIIAMRMAGSF